MKYESSILKRLIDTYGVVGNPRYISEIIKEFIVQGKERFPELFTYQADWLAHIDEFGLNPTYTVSYTGQSIYAPNTLERPVKSAILSGNTLVNLNKTVYPVTKWGANVSNNYYRDDLTLISGLIKPSTKYLFKIYGLTMPQDIKLIGTTSLFVAQGDNYQFNTNGALVLTSTESILGYTRFTPHFQRKDAKKLTEQEMNDFKMIILEYVEGMENWDIPYFEGMQSVKMPVLTTTGKKLCDGKLEMGFLGDSTGQPNTNNKHKYTPSFIKIDASKKYCLHVEADSFIGLVNAYYYDDNKNYLGVGKDIITGINTNISKLFAPHYSDASYVRFRFFKPNNVELSIDPKNIAFYESSTIIDMYEPYKSNILTVNEPIELRGIGEVKDELNLLTGELTQRIGEIVLDGSEDGWSKSGGNTNESRYAMSLKIENVKLGAKTVNDRFISGDMSNTDILNYVYGISSYNGIVIAVDNNKLETIDSSGFKKWLSQNPITVHYELAQESIKTVDLTILDQNGQSVDHLKSFNGGTHVYTSSLEGSLVPSVDISVVTNLEETLKICSLEGNTM